ncbi:MAG TPA: hypothetical protein VIC51_02710 [Psychromonas sp.]
MNNPEITKTQLITLLSSWGEGKTSSQQLQDWMITYYDPPEVAIGLNEPEWTQSAMNIIMNEYEIAKINKFRVENYALAIAFIECTEKTFNQTKHLFIYDGFSD